MLVYGEYIFRYKACQMEEYFYHIHMEHPNIPYRKEYSNNIALNHYSTPQRIEGVFLQGIIET